MTSTLTGVPVRQQHHLATVDLLDDHLMEEHLDQVAGRGLRDLRERLVKVVLRGEEGLLGARDVDDVDVLALSLSTITAYALSPASQAKTLWISLAAFLPCPLTVKSPTPSASGVGCSGLLTSYRFMPPKPA